VQSTCKSTGMHIHMENVCGFAWALPIYDKNIFFF
jgi:hypothetical protein